MLESFGPYRSSLFCSIIDNSSRSIYFSPFHLSVLFIDCRGSCELSRFQHVIFLKLLGSFSIVNCPSVESYEVPKINGMGHALPPLSGTMVVPLDTKSQTIPGFIFAKEIYNNQMFSCIRHKRYKRISTDDDNYSQWKLELHWRS